jgi:N-acyl-D-amino-acid deacylase
VEFDVLIANGTIVDGTANATARVADVGISGDRIVAVDRLDGASAELVIDARGKIVAPGFIDVHVHSEIALLGGPHRFGSVQQGVTTHLLAPDGFGWAPLSVELARQLWDFTRPFVGEPAVELSLDWPTPEAYLSIFPGNTPVNVLPQVPHCAIRLEAMGWSPRPASDAELDRMKRGTRAWLEAGATCLCLGLDYQPSAYADTRELIELCKVVREYGGLYAAHVRYTDLGQAHAWRETMAIGREADIAVHISHEHVTDVTEKLLAEAADCCDLTFESYVYPAGCTHLALMLPTWAQAGGPPGIAQRLRYPATRREMRDHLHHNLMDGIERGARAVFVATGSGRYIGMSIGDAAAYEGENVGDFAIRVLDEERPHPLLVYHLPGTRDEHARMAERTFRHPRMMVASDGIYHGQSSHPRGYGCFVRALRLARETRAVSLETAVHKMTGFPADRFRIKGRGRLAPGCAADVVVFDPALVADRATWDEPRLPPVGIERVLVNGETVVQDGSPTGKLPGRVLR